MDFTTNASNELDELNELNELYELNVRMPEGPQIYWMVHKRDWWA